MKLGKNHFKRSHIRECLILLGIVLLLLVAIRPLIGVGETPYMEGIVEETTLEAVSEGQSGEEVSETESVMGDEVVEEPTYRELKMSTSTDTFEWLYEYLNSKEAKLLTEGEYITVKKKLEGRDDALSKYILGTEDNFFAKDIDDDEFYKLYYEAIYANKEEDWISSYTKAYFQILESVKTDGGTDMEAMIRAIDKGSSELRAVPGTESLIALLRANYNGLIEEMPYYDSAAILTEVNEVAKQHPELDEVFNGLRSQYNTVN